MKLVLALPGICGDAILLISIEEELLCNAQGRKRKMGASLKILLHFNQQSIFNCKGGLLCAGD
jgi:hypothetical protein